MNNQTAERLALTLGFDFRSDATRIDGDIGYLRRDVGAFQGGIFLGGRRAAPAARPMPATAPTSHGSACRPTTSTARCASSTTSRRGLTGFIKVGARRSNTPRVFLNQNIVNYNGNTTTLSAGQFMQNTEVLSAEAGVRGIFHTGPIKHEAALVGDYLKTQNWSYNNPLAIPTNSNIYNPTFIPAPSFFGFGTRRRSRPTRSCTSLGLVDALSVRRDDPDHRRRARAASADRELQRGDRPADQRQRQERGVALGLVRLQAGQGVHALRQLHPGPAAGSDRAAPA